MVAYQWRNPRFFRPEMHSSPIPRRLNSLADWRRVYYQSRPTAAGSDRQLFALLKRCMARQTSLITGN